MPCRRRAVRASSPPGAARVVAAWPALALLLVVDMLSRSGRALPTTAPAAAKAQAEPASVFTPIAERVPQPNRPPRPHPGVPHPDTAEVPPPATVALQRNNGHVPNGNRRPARRIHPTPTRSTRKRVVARALCQNGRERSGRMRTVIRWAPARKTFGHPNGCIRVGAVTVRASPATLRTTAG